MKCVDDIEVKKCSDFVPVFGEILKYIVDSFLPEQTNLHLQTDLFKEHISKCHTNLSKALFLLKGMDQRSIPKMLAIQSVLLIGEHSRKEIWTSSECISYAEQLLNEILTICNCETLRVLLTSLSIDSFLFELQSKLMCRPNNWKKYPAAVVCFTWLLFNLKCPQIGDHLNIILPICLLLLDDHELNSKITGLQCLEHIVNNVSYTDLNQYGRGALIYNAVEHIIYRREPEVIQHLISCLTKLLIKTEKSSTMKILLWTHFDDVLNIWLPSMEIEQRLDVRKAYIHSLKEFLTAMGLASIRWSRKLLVIFSEYCVQDITCNESLLSIQSFIVATWPRMSLLNFHTIATILLKVIIHLENQDSVVDESSKYTLTLVKQCFKLLKQQSITEYYYLLNGIKTDCKLNRYYHVLAEVVSITKM